MVLVTNPLTSTWVYAVKMQIADPRLRIFTLDGKQVKQQVNPVFNWKLEVSQIAFEVSYQLKTKTTSIPSCIHLKNVKSTTVTTAHQCLENLRNFTLLKKL